MIQAADVGIGISGQEGMQVSLNLFPFGFFLPHVLLLLNKFHSSPILLSVNLKKQVGIVLDIN